MVTAIYTSDGERLESINGYSVDELAKLTIILKHGGVTPEDLRDCNECFFLGYKQAQEDYKRALDDQIERLINGGLR